MSDSTEKKIVEEVTEVTTSNLEPKHFLLIGLGLFGTYLLFKNKNYLLEKTFGKKDKE